MSEDFEKLRARYRLRFIEGAQKRIDSGLQLVLTQSKDNAHTLADELRSLAGEAAILGLDTMASVARAGADAARLWEEQGSESAVRVCEHSLHTLSDTIELLAQMNTGDFSKQAESVIARAAGAEEPN
jgi:hypothetical protein